MKAVAWCACFALVLSACDGWPLNSTPYNPPTLLPSRTPAIETATPNIRPPVPLTATEPTITGTTGPDTPTAKLVTVTPPVALTPTLATPAESFSAAILGCDTSIDILHGMGEVTNAYVKITNSTAADVPNVCATLNALDEARPHPDKTKCLPSLPSRSQVTLKLTVDTTYQQATPVQVNITSGDSLLLRLGEAACTTIGPLAPDIDTLGTAVPIP